MVRRQLKGEDYSNLEEGSILFYLDMEKGTISEGRVGNFMLWPADDDSKPNAFNLKVGKEEIECEGHMLGASLFLSRENAEESFRAQTEELKCRNSTVENAVPVRNCRTIQSVAVGQEIYLKPLGNAKRFSGQPMIKGYVTKIGKKYFYAAIRGPYGNEHRFTIVGGDGYDVENNYGYMPYGSEKAYLNDLRYNDRMLKIQKYFHGVYNNWPSMEAVDKIWDILAAEGLVKEGKEK